MQQNNDFKYVIQDTNCVYFGRELTYADMMEKDDIPFKFKAVINSHIARDIDLNSKMTDHLLQISEEEFSQSILAQSRLTGPVRSGSSAASTARRWQAVI